MKDGAGFVRISKERARGCSASEGTRPKATGEGGFQVEARFQRLVESVVEPGDLRRRVVCAVSTQGTLCRIPCRGRGQTGCSDQPPPSPAPGMGSKWTRLWPWMGGGRREHRALSSREKDRDQAHQGLGNHSPGRGSACVLESAVRPQGCPLTRPPHRAHIHPVCGSSSGAA